MSKIVSVTDEKVYIGNDDGSLLEVERINLYFLPNIGDIVEVFQNGEEIVINKVVDYKPISTATPNSKKSVFGLLGIIIGVIGVVYAISLMIFYETNDPYIWDSPLWSSISFILGIACLILGIVNLKKGDNGDAVVILGVFVIILAWLDLYYAM
jgi:hypothetical protein